jgi:hypothetical protein
MKFIHRSPFRCRNCKNRFYVYVAPERDEADETEVPAQPGAEAQKAEATQNPDRS